MDKTVPDNFKNLSTESKSMLLKSLYQDIDFLDNPNLQKHYQCIKASLTSAEKKDFRAVIGIFDKRISVNKAV